MLIQQKVRQSLVTEKPPRLPVAENSSLPREHGKKPVICLAAGSAVTAALLEELINTFWQIGEFGSAVVYLSRATLITKVTGF